MTLWCLLSMLGFIRVLKGGLSICWNSKSLYIISLHISSPPSIVVKSYVKDVANLINKCSSNFIEVKNVIDEISVLTRRLENVYFLFCPCDGNKAAHIVARYSVGFYIYI